MKFTATRPVRFSDCDPAGIVFYPQYFVMLNGFIEQWFDEGLRVPYAHLVSQRRVGLPTVSMEVDFTAVSRHGDVLTLSTQLLRRGRSSFTLHTEFHAAGELRLRVRHVLVCTDLNTHRPLPLPPDVHAAMTAYLAEDTPA